MCSNTGVWATTISGSCLPSTLKCPAVANYGDASWPATTIGQTAKGKCLPGYEGAPEHICGLTGVWNTDVFYLCKGQWLAFLIFFCLLASTTRNKNNLLNFFVSLSFFPAIIPEYVPQ